MTRDPDIVLDPSDVEIVDETNDNTEVIESSKSVSIPNIDPSITKIEQLDTETQAKIKKAFEEKGIDFDSVISGKSEKLPRGQVDASKIVQNYDQLDDDLKEKVNEALNSTVKDESGTEYKDIEEQMNEIRKEIDWDNIEYDEDKIPILNDSDKQKIISIGASDKDQLDNIIKMAIDSIRESRELIPDLQKRESEFSYEDDHFEDKETRDKYIDEKYRWKSQLDNAITLEKSSLETLAVFQQLSRKTIEELIKDNAFVRALSLVANKAFISIFPEAFNYGISTSIYKEISSFISNNNLDNFFHMFYNPFIKNNNKSPYDDISDLLRYYVHKDENDSNEILISKIYNNLQSIDKAYKYPFVVSSRYIPHVDLFFSQEKTSNNDSHYAVGWPTQEKVEETFKEKISSISEKLEDIKNLIINENDKLKEGLTFIHNALITFINKTQKKKQNTYTKKFKNYTNFISANSLVSLIITILTGEESVQSDEKDEENKSKTKIRKLSKEQETRYIYLIFLFSSIQMLYSRVLNRIINEISESPVISGQPDVVPDIVRYLNSEHFLSIDIIQRFNTTIIDEEDTAEDKKNTIKNFINDEIYKTLGEEVNVVFEWVDVNRARFETIGTSFDIIDNVLSYVIKTISILKNDRNNDLFTSFN